MYLDILLKINYKIENLILLKTDNFHEFDFFFLFTKFAIFLLQNIELI